MTREAYKKIADQHGFIIPKAWWSNMTEEEVLKLYESKKTAERGMKCQEDSNT